VLFHSATDLVVDNK